MINIKLKNNYISISKDKSMLSYCGGNQGWFKTSSRPAIANQGCGLIAAIDTSLYLSGKNCLDYNSYSNLALSYTSNHPFARLFLIMNIGILPIQICKYVNKQCKKNNLTYHFKWNGLKGHKELYDNIKRMLQHNTPVIWSIYNSKGKLTLYKYDVSKGEFTHTASTNNHYVTIIGIIENDDSKAKHHRMIEISSWGQRYYIDFDEYLAFVGNGLISKYCSNIVIAK